MKKKYKKLLLIFIILLIIIVIAIFCVNKFSKEEENLVNVIDTLDKYGYNLEDRDTKLYKDNFDELKKILNEDEVDYEKYSKTLSKLFIIDLFTIDNKISKYDVGATEFVYPDSVDNFKLNVENTIYKNVINNVNGKRSQKLPEVSEINVESTEKSTFTINEEEVESYVNILSWNYKKDLGYDDKAQVISIIKDDKLYVVEYEVVE